MTMSNVTDGAKLPAWIGIVLWISLGTSMIMFNKLLLTTWGFHYPFLLTTWHCVLATVLTQVLAKTTSLLPGVEKRSVTRTHYIRGILPMAICFASGLVLSNMAYNYISLAYIQMVKAFTPVPVLLLSFLLGREKPSFVQLGIVMVVSLGVTMSSVGELHFSAIGFAIQVSAVMVDTIRMLIMDCMLKDLALDSLSMLYYTAPPSAAMIFAGFMLVEAPTFDMAIFTPSLATALVLNGLLAFSLNIAVIYLVSSTSAMVMSISGPIKDIMIVMISVMVFGAPVTSLQIAGFAVSLTGLYLYKQFKSEAPAPKADILPFSANSADPLQEWEKANSDINTNSQTYKKIELAPLNLSVDVTAGGPKAVMEFDAVSPSGTSHLSVRKHEYRALKQAETQV